MRTTFAIFTFLYVVTSTPVGALPSDSSTPPRSWVKRHKGKLLCATAAALLALPPASILIGPSVYDYRTSGMTKAETEEFTKLSAYLGKTFSEDLKSKNISLDQMRSLWKQRFVEAKPITDALSIDWGILNYVYSKEDLALYALLIDRSYVPPGDNLYGAYNYFADWQGVRRDTDLEILKLHQSGVALHPDQKVPSQAYDFDMTTWTYDEVMTQSLPYLDAAAAQKRPEGPEITFADGGKSRQIAGRLPLGATEADERVVYEEIHRLSHLVSPLFEELLKHPNHSVSQQEFFDMAVKIYKDPWVALGAIGFLTTWDSNLDRSRAALVAHKLKPVIEGTEDPVGNLYHFWSYAIRTVYAGGSTKLDRLSWGYETVMQRDRTDRLADKLGIDLGQKILESIGE